jgi:hypothetical protein
MGKRGPFASRSIKEEMDEEAWDIRETFAFFGRTFYMASALEVGLAHALLFTEFLRSVQEEFVKTKGKDLTVRGIKRGSMSTWKSSLPELWVILFVKLRTCRR